MEHEHPVLSRQRVLDRWRRIRVEYNGDRRKREREMKERRVRDTEVEVEATRFLESMRLHTGDLEQQPILYAFEREVDLEVEPEVEPEPVPEPRPPRRFWPVFLENFCVCVAFEDED